MAPPTVSWIVSIALLASLPAAAQAAPAAGYRATQEYAGCLVRERRADAVELLETLPPGGRAAQAVESRLRSGSCKAAEDARGGSDVLRGAIAERLYLDTFTTPPRYTVGVATATVGNLPAELANSVQFANFQVALCTAESVPGIADLLVRSTLGSAAERKAIRQLQPVVRNCLPKGGRIGFDNEQMRGLIAEGLIRTRSRDER